MNYKSSVTSLDIRSLALFRVALGGCLIANGCALLPDRLVFFGSAGVLPRAALERLIHTPWRWSVFALAEGQWTLSLLWLIWFACVMAFTLGIKTRLSTALAWIFAVSMDNRNPLIGSGGELLLRLLLFWSMFLPLGAVYSVDAAMRKTRSEKNTLATIGSLAFIVQICSVYFFSALLKTSPLWRREGSALYYALHLDNLVWPAAKALLDFPNALRWLSWATLALEFGVPLVLLLPLLLPRLTPLVRAIIPFTLILFHLGIATVFRIGRFPYICIAAWLALLPPSFWQFCARRLFNAQDLTAARIYYDGDCGLCQKFVRLIREFLCLQHVQICPAQGTASEALMVEMHSWVIEVQPNVYATKFDAFVELCRLSPIARPFVPLLSLGITTRIGTSLYETVANNRARLGRWFGFLKISDDIPQAPPLWQNSLALVCMAYCFTYNLLGALPSVVMPEFLETVGDASRLDQKWTMFAPAPPIAQNIFWIHATLDNGKVVYLSLLGQRSATPRVYRYAGDYQDIFWVKYIEHLAQPKNTLPRFYYSHFLCGLNAKTIRIKSVRLMLEETYTRPLLMKHIPPAKRTQALSDYRCDDVRRPAPHSLAPT